MNQLFKLDCVLTKKDDSDFDRDSISSILNICPTETNPPVLSKGKMFCRNIQEASKELKGITIIHSYEPPYKFIKNANWRFEIPKCSNMDEALSRLKATLNGRENNFVDLCNQNNLHAELIITVYLKNGEVPNIYLSDDYISFFSALKVDICFNFQ